MFRVNRFIALCALVLFVWPSFSFATTWQQAKSDCETNAAQLPSHNVAMEYAECNKIDADSTGHKRFVLTAHDKAQYGGGSYVVTYYYFEGDGPPSTCSARSSYPSPFGGNLSVCRAGCVYEPVGQNEDGAPRNRCISGIGGSMTCRASAVYKPTGVECDGGPPDPSDIPPPPPPPRLCGGGSCCDSVTGKCCALNAAGIEVCVDPPKPGQPGGCNTLGDTTLCAGSPPPVPPHDAVPDPVSGIKASDKATDQATGPNGPYGPVNQTTINNYNNGTGGTNTANPGKGDGDVDGSGTPPSGGTGGDGGDDGAKGDGTTASGGGDCNTPPIVTGSQALYAIALQAWKTRCAIEGNQGSNLGTGQVGSLGQLYTPSTDTVASVVSGFQASVEGTPIAASVKGFFSPGGMGGSCPVWTLPATEWNPSLTFDFYCGPEADIALNMAHWILLIACAYAAFRIAFGDA